MTALFAVIVTVQVLLSAEMELQPLHELTTEFTPFLSGRGTATSVTVDPLGADPVHTRGVEPLGLPPERRIGELVLRSVDEAGALLRGPRLQAHA